MRKKKNLASRLARCQGSLAADPEGLRGRWREAWPLIGTETASGTESAPGTENVSGTETASGTEPTPETADAPRRELRLELGCGKGRFTYETAAAEPGVLFLAVEVVPEALVVAMERCRALPNVRFISGDAARLTDFFAPGEVDRIYLNFSDPWPGNRHAKRRLTHGNFLRRYREVLAPGGKIHFKTDNVPLFDFTLSEFPKYGFALSEVTRDLHANGPVGVMTDYEAKFYELGTPICRLVGTMEPWEEPFPADIREVRRRWLEVFAAGVPAEDLRRRALSEGNFLWHVFSWELVPCLQGAAAEAAFRARLADGEPCWLFYVEYPPAGPRVRRIDSAADLPEDPESLDGADWYAADRHFTWTYVHTHEQGAGLGPYFREAPPRGGEHEPPPRSGEHET